ncbi:uncharacterized protein LOC125660467 [Ostrea edulis]|uniref:uncharacterized protein LOC125660467 n=1 Tax=Ostrea edulis TaxID=37623 RepID=UPI0024AEA04D|nr:uncharacterized protein LOC125660467 [Ostrea edulis]
MAAERKNCSSIKSESSQTLAYHCLVNEFRNATLEVCAPSWYLQGFCPIYDTFEHKVKDDRKIDCTKILHPCPSRFISTESYKYAYCYNINKSSTKSVESPSNNSSPSDDNRVAIGVGVGVGVLFLVVVVVVVVVVLYVRHRKKTNKETPQTANTHSRECHFDSNTSNENDTVCPQGKDREETKWLLREPDPEASGRLERQSPENAPPEKTTFHESQANTRSGECHFDSNTSNENDTVCPQGKDREETKRLLREPDPEASGRLERQSPENAPPEKTTFHERQANTRSGECHFDSNTSNENDTVCPQGKDREETKRLLREPDPEASGRLERQSPENAPPEKTTFHERQEEVSSAGDLDLDLDTDGPVNNDVLHLIDPNHGVSTHYVQNEVGTRPDPLKRLSQRESENTHHPGLVIRSLEPEFTDLEVDVWDHGTGDTPKEKAKAYTTKHDTACYIPPQQGTQSNDNRVNNGQVPYQDFPGVISIRKEKRQAKNLGHTVPLDNINTYPKMNTKSESFPERLSNIKNQHDKIEGRLKDLQKFQSGLQGKMQFMELTVNCLERIMSELEKDSGFCVSRLHQTSGNGNLKERVTELQNRVSKIINRVERVEPHILSSTLPNSQLTLLESQVSDDSGNYDTTECCRSLSEDQRNKDDEGNLPDAMERLEDTLQKIEERLYALNESELGIDGIIKTLREKIRCTDNVMKLAENKCGLSEDMIQLTPTTTATPDQLDNLDRILLSCSKRLFTLEPLLLQ